MRSKWSRRASGESMPAPIEMRFIDMFMAALGALVFMAMLFTVLLQRVPPTPPSVEPGIGAREKPLALALLTRELPSPHAASSYELALAYRGGSGRLTWEVAAGKDDIPAGITFDTERGVLSGTPEQEGTGRFVVRIRDETGAAAEQAYELITQPPETSGRGTVKWLAIIILVIMALVWLSAVGGYFALRQYLQAIVSAWRRGEKETSFTTGLGIVEHIQLPQGITTYRSRLRATRRFIAWFGAAILVCAAFFAWRLWGG